LSIVKLNALQKLTIRQIGEQVVMNIVGLANQEMVNFLHPEEYLFGTNFSIESGNEQVSEI